MSTSRRSLPSKPAWTRMRTARSGRRPTAAASAQPKGGAGAVGRRRGRIRRRADGRRPRDCVQRGRLLVNCIAARRVGDYDRQWRRMSHRYRLLTAGVLHASASPQLPSRIVPAANVFPASSQASSTCSPNSAQTRPASDYGDTGTVVTGTSTEPSPPLEDPLSPDGSSGIAGATGSGASAGGV
jgi:hypothetical protein